MDSVGREELGEVTKESGKKELEDSGSGGQVQ
jgi:hypothetical protein